MSSIDWTNDNQHFSNPDKATLFLYLTQVGMPPWAEDSARGQAMVLARLAGWTTAQAQSALELAVQAGYAGYAEKDAVKGE